MFEPRPFQRRFLRAALRPLITVSVLSIPRGNGKSSLVAWLAKRYLTPGDDLHIAGTESHIIAASIGQARRTVFKQLRGLVADDPGFKVAESVNNCHVDHRATGTRISILAANGKTAQGLVDVPFVFADEPGAWEVTGGQLVWDALETALGKPESDMRVMLIGVLAPATGGWFHELVADGSGGNVHVTALQADRERWDQWPEIRRCNPLMANYPESRAVLLGERDKARHDTRLKARFLSYRLNVPTADESTVLLTVSDWQRTCARPEGLPAGRPIVGVDLGGGRAWSAAVAVWPSGRVEAIALAPGIPAIEKQEQRDRVPAGTYQRLVDSGSLRVADGLRVQPPAQLVTMIAEIWGRPAALWCDRFRLNELKDACPGWKLESRVTRWSEASEDIRALRKIALDGPLSVVPASKDLMTASLSVATVQNDDQGNVRLKKRGTNNEARDDVAAALTLAAGAWWRQYGRKRKRGLRHALVG